MTHPVSAKFSLPMVVIAAALTACQMTVPVQPHLPPADGGDDAPVVTASAVSPPSGGPVMATDDGVVIYMPGQGWVPLADQDD